MGQKTHDDRESMSALRAAYMGHPTASAESLPETTSNADIATKTWHNRPTRHAATSVGL